MYRIIACCLITCALVSLSAQPVTFQADLRALNLPPGTPAGVRGDIAPLSWETTYPLTDPDGDGIYTGTASLDRAAQPVLAYKYVYGTQPVWELDADLNRILVLGQTPANTGIDRWNLADPLSEEEIKGLRTPSAALLADLDLLREAVLTLHPGLYRYQTPDQVTQHIESGKKLLSRDLTPGERYMAFAWMAARFQCGHTHCNLYNQSPLMHQVLFGQPDKLPFTFDLIGKRMFVRHDAGSGSLQPGTEVLMIGGQSVTVILDSLMRYSKGDGSNDAQRLSGLEVNGFERYAPFDAYFPQVFPPQNGTYDLDIQAPGAAAPSRVRVPALTRTARAQALRQQGITGNENEWAFRILDSQLGYLRLGTYTTWDLDFDWEKYIAHAFDSLTAAGIRHLAIDIRGNEGGDDAVNMALARYLVRQPVTTSAAKSRIRYEVVPASLRPYVSTWEPAFYDLRGMVVPDGQGMYRRKTDPDEGLSLKPGPRPWTGRTYLLTDAVNSSATFYTARICQELGLATIVGEPTGGNQRGTNGGMMFFLRLPQSGVEMDIPLISYLPDGTRPDAGITPDIYITPDPARVARGEDQALEAVWQLVRTTPAPTALRAETLARAGGLYTGTLGYLDYTAGTWETLPLTASWVADGTKFHLRATFYEWGGLIRQHYVYRVQNGKFSSSGPWDIVSYTEDTARHAYQLVITRPGRDGNQRRRCTFRQTMTWDDTYMILTKEVRFEGEADFFKRNEYNLRRL